MPETILQNRSGVPSNEPARGRDRVSKGELKMANQSFQRSIRFTKREWDAVIEAAKKAGVTPGTFVRKASARAAAGEIDRDEGRLTQELAELIKRTFRGVHLLAYLKRAELDNAGRENDFRRAAEAAQDAQNETLRPTISERET